MNTRQTAERAAACLIPRRRAARGLTLVELACTMTVAGLAMGAALPGFEAYRQSRQIAAVMAGLQTDVQLARSEAVVRHRLVSLDVRTGAAGSCYVVHSGAAGDCECEVDGPARCIAGAEVIRSVSLPRGGRLSLSANRPAIQFNPDHGTVTPTATLRLTGDAGREMRAVINLVGRVRTCSVSGGTGAERSC
jgi:type IV fimbrial biogenesis protein FimT